MTKKHISKFILIQKDGKISLPLVFYQILNSYIVISTISTLHFHKFLTFISIDNDRAGSAFTVESLSIFNRVHQKAYHKRNKYIIKHHFDFDQN